MFKKHNFIGVTIQELIEQIEAKKRTKNKLETWFKSKNIYYPNRLNIEQTSSEITANYKTKLIDGESIIDLTGGFGVDCFYFSKKIKNVFHCEINKNLSKIVNHNFKQLERNNITTISEDGIEYLKNNQRIFDYIYLDPSRRNDQKGKVFLLSDCLPNITTNLDEIFKKTNSILLKTSPLLDITNCLNELICVKEIHIVAIKNEVKELLFLLKKDFHEKPTIHTINITNNKEDKFTFKIDKTEIANYSLPKKYLYEPNAAILKSGGFNQVAKQYELCKLHQHSHLYTNNELLKFPGRTFEIIEVYKYNKKELRKRFKKEKINVNTRNFPKSVEQIRKELQLNDGGDRQLIFTTDIYNKKIAVFCKKIKKNI